VKFFRNVLGTFVTDLLIVGVNLMVGVLVARWLPPAERGVLALVMLLPLTLAYFADFGVSQAIIYLLGRKKYSVRAVLGNSLVLALVLGGGVALVLWLMSDWLLATFLKAVPRPYYLLSVGLLPLLLMDTYLLSILRGQHRFTPFNFRRLLTPLLLFAGVVALVGFAGWGMLGAVTAFVASVLISLLIAVGIVSRHASFGLRFDRHLAGETLGFGAKSYLQNLVGHLHYRIDVYLLALALPPEQVAFYAVATSVAEVVFHIPNSVGTVLFPRLSVETEARMHTLTAEVARHTMLVTSLASLGILATGWWLIPHFYGAAYSAAVVPLLVLTPGVLAMAVYKVLTRNFTSRKRQETSIFAAGVALVLNVGLNLYLVPRLGVVGAALASLLSYSASALVLLLVFQRETGIPIRLVLVVQRSDLGRYRLLWERLRGRLAGDSSSQVVAPPAKTEPVK